MTAGHVHYLLNLPSANKCATTLLLLGTLPAVSKLQDGSCGLYAHMLNNKHQSNQMCHPHATDERFDEHRPAACCV